MKKDYRTLPLEECVEEMFIGPFGSSLKSDCFIDEANAYCMVYEQKHAIQKSMDVETRYVDSKKYNELKRFNIQGGDIIVSCRGTIGETYIVPEDAPLGIMHPSIMKIRLKKDIYNKNYFDLLLQTRLKRHEVEANGSGIKMAISAKELGKELFPIPALAEQKEISEIFRKISSIIDLSRNQLKKYDVLIKSRFVEMFGDPALNPLGWERTTLKEIGIAKLSYGSGASACEYDGNIRYIRITDIDNSGKLNTDIVSPNVVDEKYMLNDGDILFARSGATVGKTYRYHQSDGKCLYAGYLIRLIPNQSKVLPDYVFYFTKTSYYEDFIASNMKVVAQPNINAQQYGDLLICVPPLDRQKEFIKFVKQVDKLKFEVQQSLNEVQTLMDSLMQQYFGGR